MNVVAWLLESCDNKESIARLRTSWAGATVLARYFVKEKKPHERSQIPGRSQPSEMEILQGLPPEQASLKGPSDRAINAECFSADRPLLSQLPSLWVSVAIGVANSGCGSSLSSGLPLYWII